MRPLPHPNPPSQSSQARINKIHLSAARNASREGVCCTCPFRPGGHPQTESDFLGFSRTLTSLSRTITSFLVKPPLLAAIFSFLCLPIPTPSASQQILSCVGRSGLHCPHPTPSMGQPHPAGTGAPQVFLSFQKTLAECPALLSSAPPAALLRAGSRFQPVIWRQKFSSKKTKKGRSNP